MLGLGKLIQRQFLGLLLKNVSCSRIKSYYELGTIIIIKTIWRYPQAYP